MGEAVLTSSDAAWAWPANVTELTAEAIGGGGRGGDATNNPAYCGGGKGGSYARVVITKGGESTLNITVGAAGQSGAVNGTASTIVQGASTVLSAAGGNGVAPNSSSGATGLNGANTGTTTFAGGNGSDFTGTSSGGGGGAAGPTSVGGAASGTTAGTKGTGTFLNAGTPQYQADGGAGVAVRNAGNVGGTYGGGGSGGSTNQAADKLGANGGPGIVVLTWDDPVTSNNVSNMLFT